MSGEKHLTSRFAAVPHHTRQFDQPNLPSSLLKYEWPCEESACIRVASTERRRPLEGSHP